MNIKAYTDEFEWQLKEVAEVMAVVISALFMLGKRKKYNY